MVQNKLECTGFYESEAASYDEKRFGCRCSRFIDGLYRQAVADLLLSEETVLDVGTGTGRFAIHLAKAGKQVVALDASRAMLKTVREKAEADGVADRITLIQGDVEALPLVAKRLEGLCCIHVMVHLPDVSQSVAEFSKILQDGGVAIVEVADHRLAIIANKFWRLFNKSAFFSFPDHYRPLKDMKNTFAEWGFQPVSHRKVRKVPRFLMHFLMCRLKFGFFSHLVGVYERLPFGAVTIIRWEKQETGGVHHR